MVEEERGRAVMSRPLAGVQHDPDGDAPLWALSSALAMGADVKLYAWTSLEPSAFLISSMIESVHPPRGEK